MRETINLDVYLDGQYIIESQRSDHRIQHATFLIDGLVFFMNEVAESLPNRSFSDEGKDWVINSIGEHTASILKLINALSTFIDSERENLINNLEKERQFNFHAKHEEKPEILDLSNHSTKEDECLDLAKHFVAIINDPNTPTRLHNAIVDELGSIGGQTQAEVLNSAETIAKQLCEELEKDE